MCIFVKIPHQDGSPKHKNLEYFLDQRWSIRYHIWDLDKPWQLVDNGINADGIKANHRWEPTGYRYATKQEAINDWQWLNGIITQEKQRVAV